MRWPVTIALGLGLCLGVADQSVAAKPPAKGSKSSLRLSPKTPPTGKATPSSRAGKSKKASRGCTRPRTNANTWDQVPVQLEPTTAGDSCGVFAWLGTQGRTATFRNPAERGEVITTSSGILADSAPSMAVLSRRFVRFTTNSAPQSWWQVDLRQRRLRPTHYQLRHYKTWDTEALRNWELQASDDGVNWTTLRAHQDDTSLHKKGARKLWSLPEQASRHSYRFLRVLQTGPNSNQHHYLALSDFEVYGELLPESDRPRPRSGVTRLRYQFDFDANGIFYYLGSNGGRDRYVNPGRSGQVEVTTAPILQDSQPGVALLDRRTLRFSTRAQPNAWVMFDFKHRRVRPTQYTLRHYESWDTETLRNWDLQGSDDARRWTTLRSHQDDTQLQGANDSHTWKVNRGRDPRPYRYLRVIQTGPNSNQHHYLALAGVEFYGEIHETPSTTAP